MIIGYLDPYGKGPGGSFQKSGPVWAFRTLGYVACDKRMIGGFRAWSVGATTG